MSRGEETAGADVLRNMTAILRAFVGASEWLTEIYGSVGIASVASLESVSRRVDEMGEHLEAEARQRTRQELALLGLRIRELEAVIQRGVRADRRQAVGALLGKLSELESAVRALTSIESNAGQD